MTTTYIGSKGEVQDKKASGIDMARPTSAGELNAVALETALLEAWKQEDAFRRSIDTNANGAPFIFLEGPPTANGKPGIHHVVARAYKDLVCRWKTMEGFRVERKGGWGYARPTGRNRSPKAHGFNVERGH